jgi:hypothetical protein
VSDRDEENEVEEVDVGSNSDGDRTDNSICSGTDARSDRWCPQSASAQCILVWVWERRFGQEWAGVLAPWEAFITLL